MFIKSGVALLAAALAAVEPASAVNQHEGAREIARRSVTTKASDLNGKSFDYVVVGGGLAGLIVASRISEDSSLRVAVIEAGESGYEENAQLSSPAGNLYNSPLNSKFDWNWTTTSQSGLLDGSGNPGRQAPWPRGKVLGGSSAVNGLYYVRHSKTEQDAWASLIGAPDIWSWDKMFAAMKKSETFTPPEKNVTDQVNVQYNAKSHGTDGPLHVSWPAVSYPPVGAFIDAASQIAAPFNKDPDSGSSWGTFLATLTINPTNWTRSYSRSAYLDPYSYRSNLVVLTNYTVTKVNFDTSDASNVVAKSVEFANRDGGKTYTVNVDREVILSGGTINDPQILQLSGIGDKALLDKFNIPVVVDLPGVGQHLQDHLSAGVEWKVKNASEIAPAAVTGDALVDSYTNSAVSYVNTSTLFSGNYSTVIDDVKNNLTNVLNNMDIPDAVKQGYNMTYSTQINEIFQSKVGPLEILFAMTFGNIQVQAALQHPMSRGSIEINSTNPFDPPLIDPAYFRQNIDLEVLREGFKLARRVGQQAPLSDHVAEEVKPGSAVQTDEDWEKWIRQNIGTEFHPSCTCSMLPQEAGGVVDKNLLVYGTKNLRVIDASVPPLSVSAHLMSIVYGLAEIGAEIVLQNKGQYDKKVISSSSASASSTGGAGSSDGSNNSNGNDQQSDNSSSAARALTSPAAVLLAAAALVITMI
ncbi:hypothetical protein MCUN1_000059 [Malassezia cuniculi]|uniref:Uncharacterized protein n=1 Tax=Malassezia cuniculi TaxID=948313 RepID=A0AAF0EMW8_9BASI|nr:hypothetical protein MCUN1_000059 [Malassezia cuniculi]